MNNRLFGLSLIAAVALVAVIAIGFFTSNVGECRDFSQGTVTTKTITLHVSVATTQLDQARGLGGCTGLPDKSGLYFAYTSKQPAIYWMKGMLIPIDIIWVADKKVVGLQEYVPVPSGKLDEELPRYKSPQDVDAVIEVAAGKARVYGFTPGTPVEFSQK